VKDISIQKECPALIQLLLHWLSSSWIDERSLYLLTRGWIYVKNYWLSRSRIDKKICLNGSWINEKEVAKIEVD